MALLGGMRVVRVLVAAALLGVVGAAGGCGSAGTATPTTPADGSSASAAASGSTGVPSAAVTAPPGPAATESNPPGDIPDNQAYVRFGAASGRVSVKIPEGWARSTVVSGSGVAGQKTVFNDKLNRIEILTSAAAVAPTVASVTATDLPRLRSDVPKFSVGKVTKVQRNAGPVILATYTGDSSQDPVTGKVVRDAFERYIYYQAGTRLELTLSGPTNADNVDPWRIVSDSVQWR